MNHVFALVWNAAMCCWTVTHEHSKRCRKSTRRTGRLALPALLLPLIFDSSAQAGCLPVNPGPNATITCDGSPQPSQVNDFSSAVDNLIVNVYGGSTFNAQLGGTAINLASNHTELNNLGTIDPSAQGRLTQLTNAVTAGNGASGYVEIENVTNGVINGTSDTKGQYLATLMGLAVNVSNGPSGTTLITNSGTLGTKALQGLTLNAADGLAVAVRGGSHVDMRNEGLINGRVAFESSAGGNSFLNAGQINGSVSMGNNSTNTFTAITGSSVSNGGGTGASLGGLSGVNLTFAATGQVDGGQGGTNTLVLQNTAGVGGGATDSGTASGDTYINFKKLLVESGTWTLTGALVSDSTTLNGGAVVVDSNGALGTGGLLVTGASTLSSGNSNVVLSNNVELNANLTVDGSNDLGLNGVISGGGQLVKNGSGNLTLGGINQFSGGTALGGGTLTITRSDSLGSGALTATGNSTLANSQALALSNRLNVDGNLTLNTLNSLDTLTLGGQIFGSGNLIKDGFGELVVVGSNSFSGTLDILNGAVTLLGGTALGTLTSANIDSGATLNLFGNTQIGSLTGTGTTTLSSTLSLGNDLDSVYAGVLSGQGGLDKTGNGVVELTGNSILDGNLNIGAGTLKVTGGLSGSGLTVGSGATLTGSGAVGGLVIVGNNGHLTGTSGSTLTLEDLRLAQNAQIDVTLGSPATGEAPLFDVSGNLTLDGTLNITDGGGLGNGVYRLFNYGGNLTNNLLSVGTLPTGVAPGEVQLQSAIANQINLLFNSPNLIVQFWDGNNSFPNGTVEGGDGVWNDSTTNWTDLNGNINSNWLSQFAVFQGMAGNVTVQGQRTLSGLQFMTDGYHLRAGTGGVLTAVNGNLGSFVVRVDPNVTATVDVGIDGAATLDKRDTGTLVLNGANGYTEGTLLGGGKLVVGHDSALGAGRLTTSSNTILDSNKAVALGNDIRLTGPLIIGGSSALTLNGPVAGTGNLIKNGAATLTLGGSNSYVGNTTVNAGTLSVNGSLASANVAVNSGATLTGSGNLAGAVTVADGAHLALSADRTLSVGSLVLGSNASLDVELGAPQSGGGNALLNVGGDLTLDGTLNVTNIGGFGAGVYRLADYSGVLTDKGLAFGTLPPGVQSNDLSVQTAVNHQVNLLVDAPGSASSVQFWDGSQLSANATVDGGAGTWATGSSNWTNASGTQNRQWGNQFAVFMGTAGNVTVNGAQSITGLQFVTDGYQLSGTGSLALANGNANVRVDPGATAAINVAIDGSGSLSKIDTGTLVLKGANTYSGGTQLDGGTLVLGHASALGTGSLTAANGTRLDNLMDMIVSNAVTLDGALTLVGSNALTLAGVISGNGSLIKQGSDDLTLSGDNTFSGTLDIQNGKLTLDGDNALGNASLIIGSAGSVGMSGDTVIDALSGIGALALGAGSELQVGANNASSVYSGVLSGTGSLNKIGSGKLVLEGISSVGDTHVSSGSLVVGGAAGSNASLTTNVLVDSGATLGGHGLIGGNVNLSSGAKLTPGNSIGTLHVNGNVNLAAGSILEIEANPDGTSDKLIATGTVTLGGAHLNVLAGAGNWAANTHYAIIQAAAVNGMFADVTSNLAFLTPDVNYSATGVELVLQRNSVSFESVAATYNQRATAKAVEGIGAGTLYNAVSTLSADQAKAAFDGLSGELHASTQGALFDESRYVREGISQRLQAAQGRTPAAGVLHNDADSGLTFWMQGYGGWGDSAGTRNTAKVDHNSSGTLLGIDLPVNENWRVGVAAGYGTHTLDVDARDASSDIDSTSLTLYAAGQWDAINLRLGASHAWNDIDTSRHVRVDSIADHDKASYDAKTTQVFGELGYAIKAGDFTVEPYVGVARVTVDSDRFSEHGGATALSSDRQKDSVTYGTLGAHASTPLASVAGVPVSLQGTLGWQHAFDDLEPERDMAFAGGSQFTVQGAPLAKDTAVAQLGVTAQVAPGTRVEVGYTGQFGDGYKDSGLRLGLNVSF